MKMHHAEFVEISDSTNGIRISVTIVNSIVERIQQKEKKQTKSSTLKVSHFLSSHYDKKIVFSRMLI